MTRGLDQVLPLSTEWESQISNRPERASDHTAYRRSLNAGLPGSAARECWIPKDALNPLTTNVGAYQSAVTILGGRKDSPPSSEASAKRCAFAFGGRSVAE